MSPARFRCATKLFRLLNVDYCQNFCLWGVWLVFFVGLRVLSVVGPGCPVDGWCGTCQGEKGVEQHKL